MCSSKAGALALLILGLACQAAPPALEQPLEERWVVCVSSVRLPSWKPWISRFAHHSWIDVKQGNRFAWTRIEVWERGGVRMREIGEDWACAEERWDRPVHGHALWLGEEARVLGERILAVAPEVGARYEQGYQAWPGPNSNTFVAEVMRAVDGLELELDHNAVGKDYAMPIGLSWMGERTGVALDTPLFGLGVGVLEGLELHALQLHLGLSLFPPALELPFAPRLGWR